MGLRHILIFAAGAFAGYWIATHKQQVKDKLAEAKKL